MSIIDTLKELQRLVTRMRPRDDDPPEPPKRRSGVRYLGDSEELDEEWEKMERSNR